MAVSVAFAAHVLLITGFAGFNPYGAVGEGQGGIEIGLGMLGEMGESLESSDAAEGAEQAAEQQPESIPPEPAPPEPLPEPELQPESAPEPVQQSTEVAIQTKDAEPTKDTEPTPETVEDEPAAEPAEPGEAAPLAGSSSGEAASVGEAGGSGEDTVTQRRRSSGTGDSNRAGGARGRQASYAAALAAQLNRYKHFPMAARRARQEGTVTLSLVIRRDGSVADSSISKSSGWEALDGAALRMLERAQPLPPFPASMVEEELRIELPVSFALSQL